MQFECDLASRGIDRPPEIGSIVVKRSVVRVVREWCEWTSDGVGLMENERANCQSDGERKQRHYRRSQTKSSNNCLFERLRMYLCLE